MRRPIALLLIPFALVACGTAQADPPTVVHVRTVSVPSPALAAADGAAGQQIGAWVDGLHQAQLAQWYEAASRPKPPAPPRQHSTGSGSASVGGGRCGGDLPPCGVMMCESGGSLTAHNPRSTASGKWQVLDTTWAGYGGYSHASDAPESVQDAKAREIYAGGAGRSAWVC